MSYSSTETEEERTEESDYELFAQALGYDLCDMSYRERAHLSFQWKEEQKRIRKLKGATK